MTYWLDVSRNYYLENKKTKDQNNWKFYLQVSTDPDQRNNTIMRCQSCPIWGAIESVSLLPSRSLSKKCTRMNTLVQCQILTNFHQNQIKLNRWKMTWSMYERTSRIKEKYKKNNCWKIEHEIDIHDEHIDYTDLLLTRHHPKKQKEMLCRQNKTTNKAFQCIIPKIL